MKKILIKENNYKGHTISIYEEIEELETNYPKYRGTINREKSDLLDLAFETIPQCLWSMKKYINIYYINTGD